MAGRHRRVTSASRVLVVNPGSSSLKLSVLDAANQVSSMRALAAPSGRFDRSELSGVLAEHEGRIDAIGYRVVHGGQRFTSALRVDDDVLQGVSELAELAPLHQLAALEAIDLISAHLPETPAVACFDTAFHATLPAAAHTYALPRAWRERWGLRRYGFHGLSHEYASRRAGELVGIALDRLRIVTCHLGAGASLAAVHAGQSIDTTMGFTPLEGLVMASRSGSVDPGMLVWLLGSGRLNVSELSNSLEHESGLAGLAGTTDMREVIESAGNGDPAAALAFDLYAHRLRASIAAMAAAMDGLDVLVFTGGVGEHAPEVRAAAVSKLTMLGAHLDPEANTAVTCDSIVSTDDSRVAVVVVEAREDIVIAESVREVLGQPIGSDDGSEA